MSDVWIPIVLQGVKACFLQKSQDIPKKLKFGRQVNSRRDEFKN